MTAKRFEGRTALRAGIIGAAGLALTLVGGLLEPDRALKSYHVAFVYWAGIAMAALIMNMAFQAAHARWYVVARRVLETIPLSGVLFIVLFIPVALGMGHIFSWVHPEQLEGELRHLAEHRRPYLNVPFFLLRSALYFALWTAVAHLLHRWSVRQDDEGGVALTARQRRLGAGALPFMAVAMTFAAFDWQMSVDLHLASTIFGIYWFAGSFLSAFAVLILALNASRAEEGMPGALMNAHHYHSLGKYLLAFTAFWAYIAFSQFLLIWIANLPEEVPWYLARGRGGWLAAAIFLVVFHFVVPFFILLSRPLKRSPRALGFMAVWALVVHYVDVYWVMMPALQHDPHAGLVLAWTDVTAVVGVGGAFAAYVAWRLRSAAPIPVKDPYLEESLRYDPS
ncbi:MAG TPA: hypothetical protein VF400_08095 [Anaeromyxobacteraceae bacterium]